MTEVKLTNVIIMGTSRTLCLLICTVSMTAAFPTLPPGPMTDEEAMAHLKTYGYMGVESPNPDIAALTDADAYQMSLLSFQRMNGLTESGVLDQETARLMATPRCGMPDMNSIEDTPNVQSGRKKRFAAAGGRWFQTSLTYKITRYTPDLDESDVDEEVRRAFAVWEMVTPLRFRQVTPEESADIVILFQARSHGDSYPFDGTSGVLAHAFYPIYGGDAHFDEDETWTLNTFNGINLFQVAAHEFGHALGLGHSQVSSALMAPYYRGYVPDFSLHQDDIDGIQSVYGGPLTTTTPEPTMQSTTTKESVTKSTQTIEKQTTASPVTTTPLVPSNPDFIDLCNEGRFDAVTQHQQQDGQVRTYAFRKDYFVELLYDGQVAEGFPQKISKGWPGLPDNIDAALYWKPTYKTFWFWENHQWTMTEKQTSPSRTYFFKGSLFWRFRNGAVDPGYPKSISGTWNLPNNLDAALVWGGNGDSYFFKDDSYYRYIRRENRLHSDYPRNIERWSQDFKGGVDASFTLQRDTYITKGSRYYQFDDAEFKVISGYPKNTGRDLLGCEQKLRPIIQSDLEENSAGIHSHSLTLLSITCSLLFTVFML